MLYKYYIRTDSKIQITYLCIFVFMTEKLEESDFLEGQDIHIQTTGLSRNPIDKYYTKRDIVDVCIDMVKKYLKIRKTMDIVIEPSAGSGVFYNAISTLCNNIRMFDIFPDSDIVVKKDFLEVSPDNICPGKDVNEMTIHTIGNPPFGRQSSLAIKFIKHASTFSKTISFILPKSFKKDSMRKAFPLSFHLLYECDLPEKSFTVNGEDHDSPCIFQIWERKSFNRKIPEVPPPNGYVFVKKEKEPMLSLRRVGVFAGKVDISIHDKSEQSHYFIKITNETLIEKINEIVEYMNSVAYEFNNTVGPKSISKGEFIVELNKCVQKLVNTK
jgi:hypothetical protein|uniref:DM2 domain-containing protein n=1 Tax=viral metagenome TaxID=1070528 RepID=A0A6C0IP89_9ZZZZ